LQDNAPKGIIHADNLYDSLPHCAHTGGTRLTKLISFDIDGTLEVGDPPGIVTMDMVRLIKTLGYLIGSCSDRPVSYQQRLWAHHNIRVDFTVLKHQLDDVKAQFQTEAYYHIGDTDMDCFYATRAGFRFVKADVTTCQPWGPEVFI
jgi:hypothetical protein